MFFGGGGAATSLNPGAGYSQPGRGRGLICILAGNLTVSGPTTTQGHQAFGVIYDD
jgi:hypothetical protein